MSSSRSSSTASAPTTTPSVGARELLHTHMRAVEAELLRWEQYEWTGDDVLGTVNLVEFWKAHRYVSPLLFQIAMDVLPVQASSVSSERAFSSSKRMCTPERNKISKEHMEASPQTFTASPLFNSREQPNVGFYGPHH